MAVTCLATLAQQNRCIQTKSALHQGQLGAHCRRM